MRDVRVHLVLLVYYERNLRQFSKGIKLLVADFGCVNVVIVNNNEALCENKIRDEFSFVQAEIKIIKHSNLGFEFGGYQKGLDYVLPSLTEESYVLVCNDTFCINQVFTRQLAVGFSSGIAICDGTPRFIGQVHNHSVRFTIKNESTSRWIRSNIFAINRSALKLINDKLYCSDIEALVFNSADEDNFFSSEISKSLADHLSGWLFGGAKSKWYGAEPLSVSNCTYLANKARSILQEKYLSMRLDEQYVWFIDVAPTSIFNRLINRLKIAIFSGGAVRG